MSDNDDIVGDLDDKSLEINTNAVKKLTGQFTNRIFVQKIGDGLIKMSFGDVYDVNDPNYHTSMVVTAANAMSFAELIYKMAYEAAGATSSVTSNSASEEAEDGEQF